MREVLVMQDRKNSEGRTITIYDIAKEAGVSAATVSRVLSCSAKVSAEKREKVLRLVEKYNFSPNALAKGLAETKSKMIGILVADIRNPYYSELYISCEKAAREAGYTVLLVNSFGQTKREEEMLEKLQEQRVEAIIQLGGRMDDLVSEQGYVELLKQVLMTTPVITSGKLDGTECLMVHIDYEKAVDLLMEHLLSLGHTKIALIGGRRNVFSTYEKMKRYEQIIREHGIEFDPELVSEDGSYNEKGGYELMNRMFERGVLPTAVIAVNDFTAMGIMKSIMEHGYCVPRDISLVSYDDTYIAKSMIPGLTSINYNYEEFGKKLVETAIAASEGRACRKIQEVAPSVNVRESSGRASDKAGAQRTDETLQRKAKKYEKN